jgi:hypothetical protein
VGTGADVGEGTAAGVGEGTAMGERVGVKTARQLACAIASRRIMIRIEFRERDMPVSNSMKVNGLRMLLFYGWILG